MHLKRFRPKKIEEKLKNFWRKEEEKVKTEKQKERKINFLPKATAKKLQAGSFKTFYDKNFGQFGKIYKAL